MSDYRVSPFLIVGQPFDNAGDGGGSSGAPLGTLANPFPAAGWYSYDEGGAVIWRNYIDADGFLHRVSVSGTAPARIVTRGLGGGSIVSRGY